MTDIEKLLAMEDIRQLKARYFHCVDGKDWDGFRSLFAGDAVFDISQDVPGCILMGPESIVAAAREPLRDAISVHHGHCPEIAITSDTTATGVWAMEDLITWKPGATVRIKSLHGYGHYYETYQRQGARWLIKTLKLTRLRVDTELR